MSNNTTPNWTEIKAALELPAVKAAAAKVENYYKGAKPPTQADLHVMCLWYARGENLFNAAGDVDPAALAAVTRIAECNVTHTIQLLPAQSHD